MILQKRQYVKNETVITAQNLNDIQDAIISQANELNGKLDKTGGKITGGLNVTGSLTSNDGLSFGTGENIHFTKAADDAGKLAHGTAAVGNTAQLARMKVADPSEDDDAATKSYVDNKTGVDYVIEQGLTGKWMWRKWASGIAEMWANFDSTSLDMSSKTWGDLYTASWMSLAVNKTARQYPFPFIEPPVVSATPTVQGANMWLATNNENDVGTRLTHAPAYQCVRASDALVKGPQVSYYVIGKYK